MSNDLDTLLLMVTVVADTIVATVGIHAMHLLRAIRLFPAKVRSLRAVSDIIRTNLVERRSCL